VKIDCLLTEASTDESKSANDNSGAGATNDKSSVH